MNDNAKETVAGNVDVDKIDERVAGLPSIGVAVTHQLSSNRNIVMQTHVPFNIEVGDFNHVLDKLHAVMDRQEARYKLLEEEQNLRQETQTFEQFKEDLVAIDERHKIEYESSGRKAPYKPSPKQSAERNNAMRTAKRYDEVIKQRKERIEKLKAQVNGQSVF